MFIYLFIWGKKLLVIFKDFRNVKVKCEKTVVDWCKEWGYFCFVYIKLYYVTVQFSHSVVSNSLWLHGLQLARPPCPSRTPRACSNSSPLSQWCHPTISSSVILFFSSCLQSFPVSQFFVSAGQSIGVSASASVLPVNIQDWFPLGWTHWISLQSKGLSRVSSNSRVQKHQFFGAQLSLMAQLSHPYMTTGKTTAVTR